MFKLYLLVLSVFKSYSDSTPVPIVSESTVEEVKEILSGTRRIMRGKTIYDTRPYMVWLRPIASYRAADDDNWLCGGVILDKEYILTSAACIEDVTHFYVVSGTHKWLPPTQTNNCIKNGALRALWKCVPRTYRYDGHAFNNIRWMVNDIAVVQTETEISFTKRVKGCDFIPQPISYNNISDEYEQPGVWGFIAGWGSTDSFTDEVDVLARTRVNSPILREVETVVITKENCKFRWIPRYHNIIDNYMICGKSTEHYRPSSECIKTHVACRQLLFSEEEGPRMRGVEGDDKLLEESAAEVRRREQLKKNTRRGVAIKPKRNYGGFCENDHGGPLIYGRGHTALVIGIISAYRTENNSKYCTGPFLYTSVYHNRHLIHCAMYKGLGNECSTVLRDSSTVMEEETFDWGGMPPRPRTLYEDDDPAVLLTEKPTQSPLGTKPVAGNENRNI